MYLFALGDHAAQRRPAAHQVVGHRLEVGRPIARRCPSRSPAAATRRVDRAIRVGADRLEDGRHDVDVADRRVDDDAGPGDGVAPGSTRATISGTRSVASYANIPCVSSPCSPRLSPWSAVTMTSVGRESAASRSKSGPSALIDERDLAVVRLRRVLPREIGSGGLYGECGSKTWTHAKNCAGLAADPVDRARHDVVGAALGHRDLDVAPCISGI